MQVLDGKKNYMIRYKHSREISYYLRQNLSARLILLLALIGLFICHFECQKGRHLQGSVTRVNLQIRINLQITKICKSSKCAMTNMSDAVEA